MAKTFNHVILIGYIGKDVEFGVTGSSSEYARFSVATEKAWKDKHSGEMQTRTEWHNCVAFNKLAVICKEILNKGAHVHVVGEKVTREYEGKYYVDINIHTMNRLDKKESEGAPPEPYGYSAPPEPQNTDAFDDEIPF